MCFLLKFYEGGVGFSEIENMSVNQIMTLKEYAVKHLECERQEIEKSRKV